MFETLSDKLGGIFKNLTAKGTISEQDIELALKEVRISLLEADVALEAVKSLLKKVKKRALETRILKSLEPGQQVVKIVHEEIIAILHDDLNNEESDPLPLRSTPPHFILMVGLQGSGKTTSTVKIAHYLQSKKKLKILVASLDIYRPAAQEQLAQLAEKASIQHLPIIAGEKPLQIAKRAGDVAALSGADAIILDSAGRLSIDDALMGELKEIKNNISITETLLVADGLSGQDAIETASRFNDALHINGVLLTRMDGDARAGVALSMRFITQCPIKFLGVGEQFDALEAFHPTRIAGQILGMGDIVSLVERAQEVMEKEDAERMERRMQKGLFTMNDMSKQLQQLRKMGGMGEIMGMIPGMSAHKDKLGDMADNEKIFLRQEAIIQSMTKMERKKPDIIHSARKKRIAGGAGVSVPEVNKLLKQHLAMSKMMKKTAKMGTKGLTRNLGAMLGKNGMNPFA